MKTKALISFAVTAKLICVFVFAYAKSRFSYDAAQMMPGKQKFKYECSPENYKLQFSMHHLFSEKISSCCLELTKVKYSLHIVKGVTHSKANANKI